MFKYLIVFSLLFISCKKENQHKTALEKYIIEDLKRLQQNIDHQEDFLEVRSLDQPQKYNSLYKFVKKANKLFADFEAKSFKSNNLDSINKSLKILKSSLSKDGNEERIYNYNKIIAKVPSQINTKIERLLIFYQVKKVNNELSNAATQGQMKTSVYCGFSNTFVYPSRLNDSTVIMHVSDDVTRRNPQYFDYNEAFIISNLTDETNNKVSFTKVSKASYFTSFTLHTKSDTLNLKASLKTNDRIKMVLSKYDSIIVVGKRNHFNYKDCKYDKYYDLVRGLNIK